MYKNNKLSSNPILTFHISLNGSNTEIISNYMYTYISVLKTTCNGIRFIFSEPSSTFE